MNGDWREEEAVSIIKILIKEWLASKWLRDYY